MMDALKAAYLGDLRVAWKVEYLVLTMVLKSVDEKVLVLVVLKVYS